MKTSVLFLCTSNAVRSQMAEGLARRYLSGICRPFSAGTDPKSVDPRAVEVMKEIGIDISVQRSKSIKELDHIKFDLVITLCSRARESCPLPPAGTRSEHFGFDDPARAPGSKEEVLSGFRRVRDEIKEKLLPALESIIIGSQEG